jgi:hypothetical protein
MEQKYAPKRQHIKFRRRRNTQKREYNKADVFERLTLNSNKCLLELVEITEMYDLTLAN